MNEIMNIGIKTITNKELRTHTKSIITYMAQNERNSFKVAVEMQKIMNDGLWKDDFQKLGDYTEKFFNLKQAQAYNVKKVADRFFKVEDGKTLAESKYKSDKYGDFTVTKLLRLCPVDDEVIEGWIESEELTPAMSVREIEELVKAWQDNEQKKDNEEAEETAEDIKEVKEITEAEAIEMFNKAFEAIKIIIKDYDFNYLEEDIKSFNSWANANI